MPDAVPVRPPAHAGKPRQPGAPRKAHHHRLGLIVQGMSGDQMRSALLAGVLDQKAVARLTGGLLHTGLGFLPRPGEGSRGKAQSGRFAGHENRLPGGLGPQAMIDGGNVNGRTATKASPAGEAMHESHGVRPA